MTDPTRAAAMDSFRSEGLAPHEWSDPAGHEYDWHAHPYHKVLFCIEGSITLHLRTDDHLLQPGDRLDLPAHIEHSATVGPDGVVCLEAAKH